ncbi:hypothetical protein CR513_11043, partial [Mucuna pruriens]
MSIYCEYFMIMIQETLNHVKTILQHLENQFSFTSLLTGFFYVSVVEYDKSLVGMARESSKCIHLFLRFFLKCCANINKLVLSNVKSMWPRKELLIL